jgi:hypothetical protein
MAKIKLRRDLAATWTSTNPTLAAGEPGFETDTRKIKYGDGTTAWTSLSYAPGFLTIGTEGTWDSNNNLQPNLATQIFISTTSLLGYNGVAATSNNALSWLSYISNNGFIQFLDEFALLLLLFLRNIFFNIKQRLKFFYLIKLYIPLYTH